MQQKIQGTLKRTMMMKFHGFVFWEVIRLLPLFQIFMVALNLMFAASLLGIQYSKEIFSLCSGSQVRKGRLNSCIHTPKISAQIIILSLTNIFQKFLDIRNQCHSWLDISSSLLLQPGIQLVCWDTVPRNVGSLVQASLCKFPL